MINREEVVKNGCSGGCCEAFTLEYDIKDLHAMLDHLDAGGKVGDILINTVGEPVTCMNFKDMRFIADMLIPLGHLETNPQTLSPCTVADYKEVDLARSWFIFGTDQTLKVRTFTCKHFDTVNRICTTYETRPQMCRGFGDTCTYKGCTRKAQIIQELANVPEPPTPVQLT